MSFDISCLSETYLKSETSSDDDNLEISGYNIIRKDHSSNTKFRGVCVYKNTLPFILVNIKNIFRNVLHLKQKEGENAANSFVKPMMNLNPSLNLNWF